LSRPGYPQRGCAGFLSCLWVAIFFFLMGRVPLSGEVVHPEMPWKACFGDRAYIGYSGFHFGQDNGKGGTPEPEIT